MSDRTRRAQLLCALVGGVALSLVAPVAAFGATLHSTLLSKVAYASTPVGFARTANGTLHVVLDQFTNWGDSYNGIAALAISRTGHVGPAVQALNWNGQSAQGIPGLAVLSSGALEATWGGYPFGPDGPWGISSSDDGATWSAPVNIGSGSMGFGDSHVPLVVSNGTPVLVAGCCGNVVIQQGFGSGSPTYQVTNTTDGSAGNFYSAVDASTGAAIASWDSNDGSGGRWWQQVAPSVGAAQKAPVPSQYGNGQPLVLAGRDAGPGVFAAYPTNFANTTHMSLLRYGGASTSVGSVRHLRANVWGVATGSDGRIWVMWWGQNAKTGKYELAVTRSNNADTAFEPIQAFAFNYFSLYTLSGDGRLGPLDMLISGQPGGSGAIFGIYYARVIPVLSATVHVAGAGAHKFKLKVRVTDAGDPVSGATVSVSGKTSHTGGSGQAKVRMHGSARHREAVTIRAPGYRTLRETIRL